MKNKSIHILFFFFIISVTYSQETPAPNQTKSILLLNGTAHIGNGNMIKRSAIGFENGKITLVENALIKTIDTSGFDTVINIIDKHVYPGFIASNSTLGLMEIEAVRATRDFNEVGQFNPNIRSIIAYNTDSKITPTIRTNGVLLGQICPRGGVISGSSSIVHFDAWNWEDAIVKEDEGIHLNWPRFKLNSKNIEKGKINYKEKCEALFSFFRNSKAYCSILEQKEKDLRFEAMCGVFNNKKQLYIHADYIKELADIINFKKQFKINRLCIVGGYDSWMISESLKENNISIMLTRVHRLPAHDHDNIHFPFELPSLLAKKGVLFCLQSGGDMEQMQTRNLPFLAGTAISYGLNYEQGVSSISLNVAKILGIDNRLGSIEEGKDATFFISKGDALDVMTSNIILAYINGREISLDNDQKRNYLKYKKKYNLD